MRTSTNILRPIAETKSRSNGRRRWLGIDFSGNIRSWSAGCTTSNVWIAEVVEQEKELLLDKLGRVQTLPGVGAPFERLVMRLRTGDFCAAAIDAPFSVPADFIPDGSHDQLLALVKQIPLEHRPFPRAQSLVNTLVNGRAMSQPKPFRRTERLWQKQGINVRSTLWVRYRGGAEMTAACLTLLNATACYLWPWRQYQAGILAEAFPAAQLKTWQLPYEQYSDSTEIAILNRKKITNTLKQRLALGHFESEVLGSADAIDAVLCAFAAIAITCDAFSPMPLQYPREEGWIAVHV